MGSMSGHAIVAAKRRNLVLCHWRAKRRNCRVFQGSYDGGHFEDVDRYRFGRDQAVMDS